MMWQRKLRDALALAAALVVGLASDYAHATETKTYPGAYCNPVGKGSRPNFQTLGGDASLNAINADTAVCPIIKTVPNDSKLEQVKIIANIPSGGRLSCRLSAHASAKATAFSNNKVDLIAKETTSTGQPITFTNFAVGKGAPWAKPFIVYQLACDLTAGVTLRSYEVKEAGTRSEYQKIYPASMCREDTFEATGRYYHIEVNDLGGGYLQAMSDGGEDGGLFAQSCPVIADHMDNKTGTLLAELALGPPGAVQRYITCVLTESDSDGKLLDSTSRTVFGGGDGGEYPSTYMDLDLKKTVNVTRVRYNLYCSGTALGDAKIFGYRIQEN